MTAKIHTLAAFTVKTIDPIALHGAGYGNTYRYLITGEDRVATLAACERDVAYHYELAGLPVPPEFSGPYDGHGHKTAPSTPPVT